jgi:hypothetical protein
MNGDEFIQGFLSAMGKMPDRSPLITRVVANTMDAIKSALVPTGKLVTAALMPIALTASMIATGFAQINKATNGMVGFAIIVGSIAVGLALLNPLIRAMGVQVMTFINMNRASVMGAAAGVNMTGLLRSMALISAIQQLGPEINSLVAAFMPIVNMVIDSVAPSISWIAEQFKLVNEYLGGWPGKILAAFVILNQIKNLGIVEMVRTMVMMSLEYVKSLKVAALWTSIVAGWETIKAAAATAWAFAAGNWAGAAAAIAILGGIGFAIAGAVGRGQSSNTSGQSASGDRPQRRSSWENIYHRRYAHERGV